MINIWVGILIPPPPPPGLIEQKKSSVLVELNETKNYFLSILCGRQFHIFKEQDDVEILTLIVLGGDKKTVFEKKKCP